jgi:hypothetical protein
MKRHIWLSAILFVFLLPSLAATAVEKSNAWCWPADKYDKDGDGYAQLNVDKSERVKVTANYEDGLTCPPGFVLKRGDCDDWNANVHPRQPEVAGNGKDDNCDGRVDEPLFHYSPAGHSVSHHSFGMFVRINDAKVIKIYNTQGWYTAPFFLEKYRFLTYRVEYQRLTNTGATYYSSKHSISQAWTNGPSSMYAKLWATNLSPATVYRARIRFYESNWVMGTTTHKPVGEVSDWYYAVTAGLSALDKARTAIVTRGFYEYSLSENLAFTGYIGASMIDGTRYGADQGEDWCSEFYSYVTDTQLDGMGHRQWVGQIRKYFQDHGAFYYLDPNGYTANYPIWYGRHGDYIMEDFDQDGGGDHAAMFLAYDKFTGQYWTLEGNAGGITQSAKYKKRGGSNEAVVNLSPIDDAGGWGQLRLNML